MPATPPPDTPLRQPLAGLEATLIEDFLRERGHDPDDLRRRSDPEAVALLSEASLHASMKLTEVESRAHYVHDLHDGAK